MSVKVKLGHLRISARKVRLVADLIRGKTVQEAESLLKFTSKGSCKHFAKLLRSGVSTAEHDYGYEKTNLYISELRVDEGPTLKRIRARARGAFYPILKRTSHITMTLDQIEKRDVKRPVHQTSGKSEVKEAKETKKPRRRGKKDVDMKVTGQKGGKQRFQRKSFG